MKICEVFHCCVRSKSRKDYATTTSASVPANYDFSLRANLYYAQKNQLGIRSPSSEPSGYENIDNLLDGPSRRELIFASREGHQKVFESFVNNLNHADSKRSSIASVLSSAAVKVITQQPTTTMTTDERTTTTTTVTTTTSNNTENSRIDLYAPSESHPSSPYYHDGISYNKVDSSVGLIEIGNGSTADVFLNPRLNAIAKRFFEKEKERKERNSRRSSSNDGGNASSSRQHHAKMLLERNILNIDSKSDFGSPAVRMSAKLSNCSTAVGKARSEIVAFSSLNDASNNSCFKQQHKHNTSCNKYDCSQLPSNRTRGAMNVAAVMFGSQQMPNRTQTHGVGRVAFSPDPPRRAPTTHVTTAAIKNRATSQHNISSKRVLSPMRAELKSSLSIPAALAFTRHNSRSQFRSAKTALDDDELLSVCCQSEVLSSVSQPCGIRQRSRYFYHRNYHNGDTSLVPSCSQASRHHNSSPNSSSADECDVMRRTQRQSTSNNRNKCHSCSCRDCRRTPKVYCREAKSYTNVVGLREFNGDTVTCHCNRCHHNNHHQQQQPHQYHTPSHTPRVRRKKRRRSSIRSTSNNNKTSRNAVGDGCEQISSNLKRITFKEDSVPRCLSTSPGRVPTQLHNKQEPQQRTPLKAKPPIVYYSSSE